MSTRVRARPRVRRARSRGERASATQGEKEGIAAERRAFSHGTDGEAAPRLHQMWTPRRARATRCGRQKGEREARRAKSPTKCGKKAQTKPQDVAWQGGKLGQKFFRKAPKTRQMFHVKHRAKRSHTDKRGEGDVSRETFYALCVNSSQIGKCASSPERGKRM